MQKSSRGQQNEISPLSSASQKTEGSSAVPSPRQSLRTAWGGFGVSLLVHSLLLLLLALIIIRPPLTPETLRLTITTDQVDAVEPLETITSLQTDLPEPMNSTAAELASTLSELPDQFSPTSSPDFLENSALLVPQLSGIPQVNLSSHFGGRSSASRSDLLKLFGGTPASERAVQRGLKWLADRQRTDGSWSFDHRRPRDTHDDHQAGRLSSCYTGATGLALMAFLGAGETQQEGHYKQEVRKAIEFLLQTARKVPEGADLRGRVEGDPTRIVTGNEGMYAHALATIALCEAYGMTKDRRVRLVAQAALDFIVATRHPEQGGWRYRPLEPGDLSVSGWMIMALQSGRNAGLKVSQAALDSCSQFLDATQTNRGSQYAYVPGQSAKLSTTSIGLLCRMYLGWDQEFPALQQGIQHLSEAGPDRRNIYYGYYATQVMHHAGGEVWTAWNLVMREWLVETQKKTGPEAGSWDVTDPHGNSGGRLYQTCLSIMTLEVYYRHLPLYQMTRWKK